MTIAKQFARVSTALDEHMDQLIEVLVALLEDPPTRLMGDVDFQPAKAGIADLRSRRHGVTHVLKVPELQLCQ